MPESHRRGELTGRVIRRPHDSVDGDGHIRLIAFPSAGESASMFRYWQNWLPLDIELWPVQLPGRQDRLKEAPFTAVAPLVCSAAAELALYQGDPFAILGHSLGALVAFELARELRRQKLKRPIGLFVISCGAPQLQRRRPVIRDLPDDALIRELCSLGGIPREVVRDRELLDLVIPALRADITLFETYTYTDEEPLAVPISAFGGARDPFVGRADLSAWRAQTTAGFELQTLDGEHFFAPDFERRLVDVIVGSLRQTCASKQLEAPFDTEEIVL